MTGTQYFARYAEPEAALAELVPDSYLAALVVPAHGEAADLLDGFERAFQHAPGRVLAILVVNGSDSASPATHAQNERLLEHLQLGFAGARALERRGVLARAGLSQAAHFDLLWLDRASVGCRLPERSGVGMARKIGADLAALLWARGQLACSRIACTDADSELPDDYFSVLARDVPEGRQSSAWLWPFVHAVGNELAIHEATMLYEISLRYYVLGLAAARSGYAYQTVGSTICVEASAYSTVRGFPKREAGEDFYLLDKLVKVAPIYRVDAAPIRIRSRRSDRVPFGTGRRSQEIAAEVQGGLPFRLYSPTIFVALAAVLRGLDRFAESAEVSALRRELEASMPDHAAPVSRVLERLGLFSALVDAVPEAPPGPVLRRRIRTWFDARKTLRFVHGLRDAVFPSMPWREALSCAEFLDHPWALGSEPASVLAALAAVEAKLPPRVGPTLR